jgi:hypothetical protein
LPGLLQEDSECSRKHVTIGRHEQWSVFSKASSSLSTFSVVFIWYGSMTKRLQSLLSSHSVYFPFFCQIFISSWCLPVLGRTFLFCVVSLVCNPLNFCSYAWIRMLILSILSTWPNHCNCSSSNFINKFWIPTSFVKKIHFLICSFLIFPQYF